MEKLSKQEIIYLLKKANSLSNAALSIIGVGIKNKRAYFPNVQQRFKGKYACIYHKYFRKKKGMYNEIIKLFLKESSINKSPGDVIDLGCGSVNFLVDLAKYLPPKIKLYGIDKSEIMFKLARKNIKENKLFKRIKIYLNGMDNLAKIISQNKIFPIYVISISTLHTLKNPTLMLEKILRVKQIKEIFIQDIIRDSPWEKKKSRLIHLAKVLSRENFIEGLKGHLSSISKKEFRQILSKLSLKYNFTFRFYNVRRKRYFDETIGILIQRK